MPEKPKNKRVLLTEMFSGIDELLKSSVTHEEMKEVLDSVAGLVRDIKQANATAIAENTAKNKGDIDSTKSELESRLSTVENTLRNLVLETKAISDTELDTKLNMLRVDIEYVESLIKDYDDTELRKMIDEVKKLIPKMPKEFDASEILSKLEELEKKIEELEKRPVGRTGGGVTDMRIRQAFKNILLTEAPVGAIDGVNATYTLSQPIFAILSMSINGETIAELPNYTISNRSFTFSTALPAAYSGKDWEVKYIG